MMTSNVAKINISKIIEKKENLSTGLMMKPHATYKRIVIVADR